MDVSEARRGQGLEIDHKEIARRNTQALVTVKTDYHVATPLFVIDAELSEFELSLSDPMHECGFRLTGNCSPPDSWVRLAARRFCG